MTDRAYQEDEYLDIEELAVGSVGHRASGWWGMLMLVATEASLFAYLLFSYYYFALESGRGFLPAELPSFRLSGPATVILVLSSVAVWFGERNAHKANRWRAVAGLLVGTVLGAIFVGIQVLEWMEKPFGIDSDPYGSLYFTITGFHMAHVVGGLLMLAPVTLWTGIGYFDRRRLVPVTVAALYWHFVDVVWLTIFFTFYVMPRLG